jgi:hypothetical protein
VIRVTKSQVSLLKANLARAANPADTPGEPRRRRPKTWLPENILERQITDFLALRGFITTRQHVGTFVPYRVAKQIESGQLTPEAAARNVVRIGEEGAADWWSARPIIPPGSRACDGPWPWQGFFWEAKAPGRRPTDRQLEWMWRRQQVGLEAAWFNQFAAQDRPSPAVEPRDSHVFEIWFSDYFGGRAGVAGSGALPRRGRGT